MGLPDMFALLIGSLTLSTAVMVVLSRNAVYSAIYLLLTLLGVACEYVMLQAHFLAIIQVLVYAGAVVVLIVFVLMMMGFGREQLRGLNLSGPAVLLSLMLGGIFIAAGGGGVLRGKTLLAPPVPTSQKMKATASTSSFKKNVKKSLKTEKMTSSEYGTIQAVGKHLISYTVVPFEVISVLLLMAIVGVVMLLRGEQWDPSTTQQSGGDK